MSRKKDRVHGIQSILVTLNPFDLDVLPLMNYKFDDKFFLKARQRFASLNTTNDYQWTGGALEKKLMTYKLVIFITLT
ncbi:MAG: hypothetical protein OMM_12433 [Candidatus Magnetoglobus multicellularis str. Araruama]|uniref:Uncharacterized protein n=1 Tax=Candidatus Magnetoglobus multicellularis str. Araruama TaxID=890399 RepID=A0A1V1NVV8_9BACT|nr:MAG: hypothetical protein OMM_12433 [Candidatus Magnetoglobus multicellularis str. Araruama]